MDFNPEILQNLLDEDLAGDDSFPATYQRENLLKKYVRSSADADRSAITLFKSMNERARTLQFADTPLTEELIDFMKSRAYDIFMSKDNHIQLQRNTLDLRDCIDQGKAGPGSSAKVRHSDFYRKMFDGPMTVTSIDLYMLYKYTISNRWREAENIRSQRFKVDVVEGSSLSCVPKTKDISRTICSEPSLNMFFQLGAGRIIERLLQKFYHIDLSLQPDINRSLAKLGSIDGSYATIDLKSASDSISLNLVRAFLPPEVLESLMRIRSTKTRIEGEYIDLHIMSSMGNGFCFPLQTMIFAMICEFAYRKLSIKAKPHVFGDDIICVSEAYDLICQLLECLGFIVNDTKSFSTGPFRESCGNDYYSGVNVRSVYIRSIRNDAEVYSAFNRLHRWSVLHSKPLLRTLSFLLGLATRRLYIPYHESDAAGFKVPAYFAGANVTRNGSRRYSCLESISKRLLIKSNAYNYQGALISFLGGYVRRNALTLRINGDKVYKVVRKVTPCWDYQPDSRFRSSDFDLFWHTLSH